MPLVNMMTNAGRALCGEIHVAVLVNDPTDYVAIRVRGRGCARKGISYP